MLKGHFVGSLQMQSPVANTPDVGTPMPITLLLEEAEHGGCVGPHA